MRDDVDADADRQRVAAVRRAARIPAGCRRAWRRRPARRSAISARSGCRDAAAAVDADADPAVPARSRPARRTAPARRRSRASRQASTRRGRPAAASRRDCRAGFPSCGRAGRGRSPGASRRSTACRDRRCLARSSASALVEPTVSCASSLYPSRTAVGASSKPIRRRSWRPPRPSRRSGRRSGTRRTARRRRDSPSTARSSNDIGWKAPTGSSNHMSLMMRR